MIYLAKLSVFATILDKFNLPDGQVYKVILPSGLITLVWARDAIII